MSSRDRSLARSRSSRALTRPSVRQLVNLGVAIGGTLGGVILLGSNLAVALAGPVHALPWVPLAANAALIFGGVMFAREYRRSRMKGPADGG